MRPSPITVAVGEMALMGTVLAAPSAAMAAPNAACKVSPAGAAHGQDAIDKLGDRLPEAALKSGLSVAQFAQELRRDPTLWVDSCASPYYVEPTAPTRSAVRGKAVTASALDPSGDAFTLHSRPGSNRTIYLDFNGQSISGTAWNSSWNAGADWTAPAYSADADPAFNSSELNEIRNVWLRVAEDYAPFNIDVTTQDPGVDAITRASSTDNVYGTRVLISNDTIGYNNCGCGGVAYVGTVDLTSNHAYYQPAWVFTKGIGTSAKTVAEAASHEAGHNFGLSHDGTVAHDTVAASGYYSGQGSWAPIMGVGYYKPVTQWSKGEYNYASQTQDDFVVMGQNGAVAMADDHGDSMAAATPVTGATAGLIGTRTDTDWFSFQASGSTTVEVTPQPMGPNLDARLDVYDSTGTLIASRDPAVSTVSSATAAGLDAGVTLTLAPGTYYASVDGVGWGDPLVTGYSDYGSVGRYEFEVVATSPSITTTSLPAGTVGAAYSATLQATGGTSPYTWSLASGTLPAGLSLSGSTISGTPTTAGSSTFTVKATDAAGASATANLTITVNTAPLTVTTTSLPAGKLKTAYKATLQASGGTTPYTWSVASGKLPTGLSLSSTGTLSGTPSKAGTYTFTLRVKDAKSVTASRSYSVTVTA